MVHIAAQCHTVIQRDTVQARENHLVLYVVLVKHALPKAVVWSLDNRTKIYNGYCWTWGEASTVWGVRRCQRWPGVRLTTRHRGEWITRAWTLFGEFGPYLGRGLLQRLNFDKFSWDYLRALSCPAGLAPSCKWCMMSDEGSNKRPVVVAWFIISERVRRESDNGDIRQLAHVVTHGPCIITPQL